METKDSLPASIISDLFGVDERTAGRILATGLFGTVLVPAGYTSRHRVVARAAVETVKGPISDEQIEHAIERHARWLGIE